MAYFITEGRHFTATASESITAGDFVKAMSSVTISSDNSSTGYQLGESCFVMCADAAGDENITVGIAEETATIGSKISVCTEGIFRIKAGAATEAGDPFKAYAVAGSADAASQPVAAAGSWERIGRALTEAGAANEYFFGLLRI